jgi:hypothetical protein
VGRDLEACAGLKPVLQSWRSLRVVQGRSEREPRPVVLQLPWQEQAIKPTLLDSYSCVLPKDITASSSPCLETETTVVGSDPQTL